jgi:ketosteroid isomerase-like protein
MLSERLLHAINEHNLDAFVACFDPDYSSEQPAHPARAFRGREQVRKNWSAFFREIPDLQAELLASAAGEDTEWGEWHWHGTLASGGRFEMRGVTLMGTRDDHIVWGRLYMEEVEQVGEDIDQAVQRLARAGGNAGQAN